MDKVKLAFAMLAGSDCNYFDLGTSAVHVSNWVYILEPICIPLGAKLKTLLCMSVLRKA